MAHPIACWATPEETEHEMAWVQRVLRGGGHGDHRRHLPQLRAGHHDRGREVRASGEEKYQRLVGLKDAWDPGNLFRVEPQHPADGLDAGGRACPVSRGPDPRPPTCATPRASSGPSDEQHPEAVLVEDRHLERDGLVVLGPG